MGSFLSSQMKCVIACIAAASALTEAQKEYLQGQSDARPTAFASNGLSYAGLSKSKAAADPDSLDMSVLRTGVAGPGRTKMWTFGMGCPKFRLLNDNDPS